MKNILYIDDYINYYSSKLNKTIVMNPYKDTLYNGRIINKEKFIKSFNKLKENNKINNSFINEDIIVIINSYIKDIDKKVLKEVLEELNYKNIKFISELEIIKIQENKMFINYNYSYFRIYVVDKNGKIRIFTYENNKVNNRLIIHIIRGWNKKEIIVAGKNYKELLNILKESKFNYYYFDENDNLLIKLYLKKTV